MVKPEGCADFRGPGCYRYDDKCRLLEYRTFEKCHQYVALSPEDAETVMELIDSCIGDDSSSIAFFEMERQYNERRCRDATFDDRNPVVHLGYGFTL